MRELDVSVHFNAVAGVRTEGIGTEVLHVNPAVQPLAQQLSAAIASVLAGQVQTLPFSSDALTSRVLEMWADEPAVIRQLERGVADGVFQDVWLQRAKVGTLSIHDYLALCALQLKNISKSCNLFEACSTNYIEE